MRNLNIHNKLKRIFTGKEAGGWKREVYCCLNNQERFYFRYINFQKKMTSHF